MKKVLIIAHLLSFFCMQLLAADYKSNSTIPTNSPDLTKVKPSVPKKTKLENVIIVYKTHFDLGYTARVREVVHEYRTYMADKVLDAIDANSKQPKDKQFVWTLSGWPMKQILWEGQAPERRKKIEQAIKDGNLVIHAYPFTTHTESAEIEGLVRGLSISSELCRKYGLELPLTAKMTDVPGQSWIFPTLFKHAGMKFYHMGGPLVNKTFNLPPMFWWEGPDGSRLLTMYNNGYGTSPLPPENWPYKTWIYICMTGDNQGPPAPNQVNQDIEFYQKRGIKARAGSMDDFADLILQDDLSNLPVVRSDLPDPWIHGLMSFPEACKQAQNVRPFIGALDSLTTLERIWGIYRPDISRTIADAYEQSMLFSEHTFGMANQHYIKHPYGKEWEKMWAEGLPPNYHKMAESWKDHADYIDNAERLVSAPITEAISMLADNVNVNEPRIVVYNPLPWKRGGEVLLNCFHMPHGVSLRPVDGGPLLPYVIEGPGLETPGRIRRFFVNDIPPMGYRTFVVTKNKSTPAALAVDQQSGVIESPFFKATLDTKRGRIISLIEKRSGRELVDNNAPQGFGQYFHERFSWQNIEDWLNASLYPNYPLHRFIFAAYDMPRNSKYSSSLPENMTLSVKKTPIDVTAVMTGTLTGEGQPQQISIRLTLSTQMPVADLKVMWDKKPDGWPEAAWICLPFKIENPQFRLGRLGGDLDPIKDITVDYVNYHNSWVNTGVAIYDEKTGAGIGVCPQDTPLVSLGVPGEYKFAKRYEPKKPYVYLNLYNNHWRTNFASWIGDGRRMSARVRIWAFDKYDSESALYTPAMETRVPLIAARSTTRSGKLPLTQAGITLSRKGVAITAFGSNPDGEGTVLRLWEQGGKSDEVTVRLPANAQFKTALPVNLRGEKVGEAQTIENGILRCQLRAYAPASFILK